MSFSHTCWQRAGFIPYTKVKRKKNDLGIDVYDSFLDLILPVLIDKYFGGKIVIFAVFVRISSIFMLFSDSKKRFIGIRMLTITPA